MPSKRTSIVIAAFAIVAAGATWLLMKGGPQAAKVSTAVSTPITPVAATPVPAPAGPPPETEVTIPASDLSRLQLKFAKATLAAVNVEVRVPGTVQPNAYKQVRVAPIAGGVVTQVAVELGQSVKRGQTVAQIFSRDLAEAQTTFLTFNSQLEVEHKKLQRTEELVKLGAASRQEMEEVEGSHQVHAAHVEESRQRLLLLGLNERQVTGIAAGKQVSSTIDVPSPLDGIVTARAVNSGQVVVMGQELLSVTDLSSVWIEASVLENDFAAVRMGSRASITTPAYPGREYHGVVEYIDPQVDPQTRTAKVRVSVENPKLALRLDMYMDVLFSSGTGVAAPVVPKEALQSIGPANVVYIPVEGEPGRFLQRAVRTGEEVGSGFRVLEGLKAGETVVTHGSFLLRAEAIRQHP
jgi:membrane fusion protein, heavy metal efflux system